MFHKGIIQKGQKVLCGYEVQIVLFWAKVHLERAFLPPVYESKIIAMKSPDVNVYLRQTS